MKIGKTAISFIASLPIVLCAQDCCMPSYIPGEPLCDDTACAIYTAYAGIDLNCGWNVNAWGEFLYWRPVPATAFNSNTYQGEPLGSMQIMLKNTTQGYRPAFRVGLGITLHELDDWTLNIDYFWYHHSFRKTYSVQAPILLASTLGGGNVSIPQYSSISNRIDFNFDIISINVQRPNYLTQRVIISPFLGFKWLDRKDVIAQQLFRALGPIDFQSTTLKKSSVALAAGLDGYFLLCWGMYLIGKADVGLYYPYKRRLVNPTSLDSTPTSLAKQKIKTLGIVGKGGLGVGWGSYFCCNRYHADLSASFDFFSDVAKLAFASGMWFSTTNSLIGLTIRGQFDF